MHDEVDSHKLTRIAQLSLVRLRERFRAVFGEPLATHIRRLRLERAAAALTFTRQSVLDIAVSCGFESHEGFTRAFHRVYGVAPQTYRDRQTALAEKYRRTSGLSVRLVERSTIRVAFLRYIGPVMQSAFIWPQLFRLAQVQSWAKPGARLLGIHYENPEVLTDPSRVRYDAGITVDPGFSGNDDMAVQELPGGLDAVVAYEGPLADLEEVWHRFALGWMAPGPFTWRDDRFFDVYPAPPEPWLVPEAPLEALQTNLSLELHIPVTRGHFSAEPTPPEP